MQSLSTIRQRVERLAATAGRCDRDHAWLRVAHVIGGAVVFRSGPGRCEACGARVPETQLLHEQAA